MVDNIFMIDNDIISEAMNQIALNQQLAIELKEFADIVSNEMGNIEANFSKSQVDSLSRVSSIICTKIDFISENYPSQDCFITKRLWEGKLNDFNDEFRNHLLSQQSESIVDIIKGFNLIVTQMRRCISLQERFVNTFKPL